MPNCNEMPNHSILRKLDLVTNKEYSLYSIDEYIIKSIIE